MTNDELQIAVPAQPAQPTPSSSSTGVRCVGGHTIRPRQQEEEPPSTARSNSSVLTEALGGVRLGSLPQAAAPPCFGQPPELAPVLSTPLSSLPSTGLPSQQSIENGVH